MKEVKNKMNLIIDIGNTRTKVAIIDGAMIIEKHFTLDSTLIGMVNHMAIEPEEMKNLVDSCNNIFMGLGGTVRSLSKVELKQRKKMRRSIIVNKNMKKRLEQN